MNTEIIKYLYSFNDNKYHSLNDFLKNTFPDDELGDIRRALSELVTNKRIEIELNNHLNLNNHSQVNSTDVTNTFRDLDNLPIAARLTNTEKEKLKAQENNPPNNVINIGTNHNSPIFQDIKSDRAFKPIINPPTVPTTADTKQGKTKTIIDFILKNILVIILSIIAGLVVAYYAHLFRWNK